MAADDGQDGNLASRAAWVAGMDRSLKMLHQRELEDVGEVWSTPVKCCCAGWSCGSGESRTQQGGTSYTFLPYEPKLPLVGSAGSLPVAEGRYSGPSYLSK